ncbi:MAG: tRNA (N6-isopentenyl adenosine(37)-C2)-methylthiotransferase MiaB [Spirochaetales bacterium]|nr:tRNA (N6-isopentenyl adenosine(37)-C2)-methylthiotransferase MiaB [Spirochaetales bacterium]
MKYYLKPLGCQMNISDSERIRNVLDSAGFCETFSEDDADVLGVVACSVRQKAIDKVYSLITKWNRLKNKRTLITFITGCILDADRSKFLDRFDFIFPVEEITDFPGMIAQYGIVTSGSLSHTGTINSFWNLEPAYSSSFQAFVPIQNGCDKYCTYCAVPYTRGREISRPAAEILSEVNNLVHNGYKSITLLGQNVNSYGRDKRGNEISFAELLRKIGVTGQKAGRKFWLYFTSPHPRDMTNDVLETIASYDCLGKWIHFPLQSGDNDILNKMNRNYTVEQYEEKVKKIRSIIPSATLFTDIIVGFPGETEQAFQNTRRAFSLFRYNMAYIAMYSPRPGAKSTRFGDDVTLAEKKKRFRILSDDLQKISYEINTALIGKEFTVLIESQDRKPGYLSAKTEGRLIIRLKGDNSLIGTFVRSRITSAASLSLEGEIIRKVVS